MPNAHSIATSVRRTPWAWLGPLLIAVFWPLNWLLPDASLRTAYFFFPLWLGYALSVDAWVAYRRGTSVRVRSRVGFLRLFAISAPAWWLFEAINRRTRNWEYLGAESFTDLEYFALCTIAFSTVMPAVFGTAELVRSFGWTERFAAGPRIGQAKGFPAMLFGVGVLLFSLVMAWPVYFYPFVWVALVFLIEPINMALGRRSLLTWLKQGDWRPMVSLSAGALICGFFWEMWNHYSYPKWIYHTPGAQFLHVFQMPILGYLGYIPFSWELYSLWRLFLPREEPLNL